MKVIEDTLSGNRNSLIISIALIKQGYLLYKDKQIAVVSTLYKISEKDFKNKISRIEVIDVDESRFRTTNEKNGRV